MNTRDNLGISFLIFLRNILFDLLLEPSHGDSSNEGHQDTFSLRNKKVFLKYPYSPCHFSPLAEIPGSKELMENSLTYEGVQWRKIIQCISPSYLEICKRACHAKKSVAQDIPVSKISLKYCR